ncbi:MAG: DUF370 domain-containing protein [bacterium]|nr:DUF370 domain-containing protein [bacterium]
MKKQNRKIILDIGFKNSVLMNNIEGIFSYKAFSYIISSEFLKKKEESGLVDKINKKEKKSFILFKNGSIIVSPLEIKTLIKRSK